MRFCLYVEFRIQKEIISNFKAQSTNFGLKSCEIGVFFNIWREKAEKKIYLTVIIPLNCIFNQVFLFYSDFSLQKRQQSNIFKLIF